MKKIISLVAVFVCLIIFIVCLINKERTYMIDYNFNGYKIIEEYDLNYYTFTIKKDDLTLNYVFKHKYSSKRKLIQDVEVKEEKENDKLYRIKVFNEWSDYIRLLDNKLVAVSYKNYNMNSNSPEKIDNINVFNKDNEKLFIWNSHGFKDIYNNKEYNFIDKEQYDNPLSYQFNEYIIVPDYNQSKTFNIFYVIDTNKQKVSKWKVKYKISFDSYFLGSYDGNVYLFDKDNEKEYSLNIAKRKISKISNSNGGIVYEGKLINYSLSDLKYKNLSFKNNYFYNFSIKDKKLYMNYYGSKDFILMNDMDIIKIIGFNKDNSVVYFLSGDTLYKSNIKGEIVKLASYFEWNFSFENKIYVIDN